MHDRPAWVKQLLTTDFYNDYPTNRESGYGPKTKRWMRESRKWMIDFLVEIAKCNESEIVFNQMYYEWSIFAKIGDQWWYFSTGDIRFLIMRSLLVRTAKSDKDYTGGRNQFVEYESPTFTSDLAKILGVVL